MVLDAINIAIAVLGFKAARVDFKSYVLPNFLNLSIFSLGLLSQLFDFRIDVLRSALLFFIIHLVIAICRPNAFGMGDVKFIAGLALTFPTSTLTFLWLYCAYLFGSIHGFWRKIFRKSSRIPFGVSLYGAWIVICVGEWASVALDYSR